MRPHPTYFNVTATLALFIALGGTGAYATGLVTGADVQDESLTGADVLGRAASASGPAVDGSLTTYDLKNKTVAAADLATSAVTNEKLRSDAVTSAKVAT